jgi:hypothetical protein
VPSSLSRLPLSPASASASARQRPFNGMRLTDRGECASGPFRRPPHGRLSGFHGQAPRPLGPSTGQAEIMLLDFRPEDGTMDNNDPWKHPAKQILSLLNNNASIIIPVITLILGYTSPYFVGHYFDQTTILIVFTFVVVALFSYFTFRYLLKKPSFRHRFGFCSPYEGVWVETFTLRYEDEATPTDFISIFILHPTRKSLQMDGFVFNSENNNTFSEFDGKIIYDDPSDNHIVYRYNSRFRKLGKPGAKGYGMYNFRKSASSNVLDCGNGEFVELVGYEYAVRHRSLTTVERINSRTVRRLLGKGKYFPERESDYKRLLSDYVENLA